MNRLLERAATRDETLAWAIAHGRHVSGAASAYDYLKWAQTISTRDVSHLLKQDVLLLGAQEDHLIPLAQFYSQQQTLTNVRSLTARLFTSREHASSHCQVGNTGLSLDVIINWVMESKRQTEEQPAHGAI
ncbi:hypothetical protein [Roseibium sp. RKSG952]|uniref:hypothetical protein n=1 Tax=Roseibium sp. RKSG952 TaxID=2529384 RepID=UPI0012BBB4E3|nr:hypothetical protein [Roseibium sp. RKSG952]MTH95222.1 hypothetical protein [Roseibium sp. RKSG952]